MSILFPSRRELSLEATAQYGILPLLLVYLCLSERAAPNRDFSSDDDAVWPIIGLRFGEFDPVGHKLSTVRPPPLMTSEQQTRFHYYRGLLLCYHASLDLCLHLSLHFLSLTAERAYVIFGDNVVCVIGTHIK
ncbi:hypothetical protein WN944_003810 [Citrus x changshan-huyou]|uniref:Uncharacterized protein n=1 Tax=Citrus x changshan-huyou TaxID=2935761 RepID=A0AAP0LZA7_9ROSI